MKTFPVLVVMALISVTVAYFLQGFMAGVNIHLSLFWTAVVIFLAMCLG